MSSDLNLDMVGWRSQNRFKTGSTALSSDLDPCDVCMHVCMYACMACNHVIGSGLEPHSGVVASSEWKAWYGSCDLSAAL